MISTKFLVSELTEVPREWIFEHYLKLEEKLEGQDLKIKSVFGTVDKNPYFHVYYSVTSNCYRFKDFSTGKSGDALGLVQEMFKLTTRGEAAHKIMSDYNQFMVVNKGEYTLKEFKVKSKFKVKEIDEKHVIADCYGEPISHEKGGTVVKAVTMYKYKFEKTKQGYKVRVSLDI